MSCWSCSTRCARTRWAATADAPLGRDRDAEPRRAWPGTRSASPTPTPSRCRRSAPAARSTRARGRIRSTTATSALKGDFLGVAPGWGPIPERAAHPLRDPPDGRLPDRPDLRPVSQFKPSKNFWRGFDQWTFIRGQETDTARSGPGPTQEVLDQVHAAQPPGAPPSVARRLAKLPDGHRLVLDGLHPQHARPGPRGALVQRPGLPGGRALAGAEPRRRALLPDRRVVRSARAVVRARALPGAYDASDGPGAGALAVRRDP